MTAPIERPGWGAVTVHTPRFSVVTTVFDPEPEHLLACIASVDAQAADPAVAASGIEHVLVDDRSTRPEVAAVLRGAASTSHPVTRAVIRRDHNGGIVAASNDALAAATGDFVVLLDHDDVLADGALASVAAVLDADDSIDVVYSDHDLMRPDGRCAWPMYKPDFSLERLRHHNYITHLVVARRSLVDEVGGFTPGTDGAQDHDLLLRLAEVAAPFHHVPEILLHWRQAPNSSALDSRNKPAAISAEVRAVAAHLERCGIDAEVTETGRPGVVRTRRRIVGRPLVSVVIPTRGSRGRVWGAERIFVHDAVSSIVGREPDVDLEFVVVLDAGSEPVVERGLRRIAGDALRIVHYDRPFNFSDKINEGVSAAAGEYVLLLNDDTEMIEPGSIAEMVGLAQQPDVGMVGSKLLFDDGTLQHGGHLYHGTITHSLLGWASTHPGPYNMANVVRECVGATAAGSLMRRDVFLRVGGMNTDFPANYNDVDLSMTVRHAGYRILWTPEASWYHFESRSFSHPIDPAETALIEQRWGRELYVDPYSNPNLTPGRNDWLELPGRSGAPPYEDLPDGRRSWG
ncbi:MAG: glycosyltransferase [Ilumatobacter sp.]